MTQTKKKLFFSWVLILAMVISVISPGSASLVKAEGTDYQAKLAGVTKCLHDNVDAVYGGEWALIVQARGTDPDTKWLHTYYDSLIGQLNDQEKTAKMSAADWARVILSVESLGEDPADINGSNLFTNLADFTAIDYGSIYAIPTMSYILLAVGDRDDSVLAAENIPDENQTTKAKLKAAIMSYYDKDNKCWGGPDWYTGVWTPDPDISAQAVQGLSVYYDSDKEVKEVIDNTLSSLSEKTLGDDGCITAYGAANVCSTAQVICALISVGINPTADSRFIKNGKTLVDGLCTFFDPKTGGVNAADWTTGEEYLDLQFNTVQAGYALAAYDRSVNGKSFVFDSSDVKAPIYHYGGKATCAKKAVCEVCGKEYGELDPDNHAGKTSIKNAKEATYTENGYTGDKVCDDCGAILEKGKEIPKIELEDKTYDLLSTDSTDPSVLYSGSADSTEQVVTIQNTVTDNKGVTYKVTKVADSAFAGNKTLTDVTLGSYVTEIGAGAFKNCTKLSNVIVQSDSLTTIGANAFSGDKALKEIDFSECKLKTINSNAFSGCKKLKDIKLNGNKLTKVGKNAFKNIKKNAKITICAKNKKTYNKVVKLIKKSGAKKVKYAYQKQK